MSDEQTQALLAHVTQLVRGGDRLGLAADSPLVSSGLIDSFALVDLLLKVEDVTGLRIPAAKVRPQDMDTVVLMLQTAHRLGTPRAR